MTSSLDDKVLNAHIDLILDKIYEIKNDMRLCAGFDLYGLKQIIAGDYMNVGKKLNYVEDKRRGLAALCKKYEIEYEYAPKSQPLKNYINIPIDTRDKLFFLPLKVSAYLHTYFYLRNTERELFLIKKQIKN